MMDISLTLIMCMRYLKGTSMIVR